MNECAKVLKIGTSDHLPNICEIPDEEAVSKRQEEELIAK